MADSDFRLDHVFREALKRTNPADREKYLREACGADESLYPLLRRLVDAHESAETECFPEALGKQSATPPVDAVAVGESLKSETPGETIGRYKVLEKLGEGGFGTVWMAQQEQPVRRRVALKIVKLGMDTKDVVARFDQERQALAMMDHPSIAKVFDGGATPEGRPYFVMELVPGIPITDYCDRNSLPTEERLGLFIQVCQAVQHAHQKGIIHRDIKPSNVLVCLTENSAVPKVIDFGIAKATQQRLTDLSVFTQLHAMIGTPHYMSPEQAEGSLDIDTRTDIYSLGALLYELLTGAPPFSTEELRRRGVDEIQRMIREIEPKRPSTALSAMHQEKLSKVAKLRSSEAPKLIREFRADLDWIVMKALEKDRTRRYEAANDLAGDVRRYLSGEAVVAAAPNLGYRLRKFTRRHRTPLAFAALTSLALIAATGISLWQMNRAVMAQQETKKALGRVEERTAELARNSAELSRQSAELARKSAEQQAMLVEAARSDRLVADEKFGSRLYNQAFAHLARACEYDGASTLAAETAVGTFNNWSYPFPDRFIAIDGVNIIGAVFKSDSLFTWSNDGTGRFWNPNTGALLKKFGGNDQPILGFEFSPDLSRLLGVSDKNTACLWDVGTGSRLHTLQGHTKAISGLSFSPDGLLALTTSQDGTARIWDLNSGKSIITLAPETKEHYRRGCAVGEFSPDGTHVATGALDGNVQVWDVKSGSLLFTLAGHKMNLKVLHYSPDGSRIATAAGDSTARVWDAATGQCLVIFMPDPQLESPELESPDLRIETSDPEAQQAISKEIFKRVSILGRRSIDCLKWSPAGDRVVSTSRSNTVQVWDPTSGKMLIELTHGGVAQRKNREIRLTGASEVRPMDKGVVEAAEFSPDGKQILTVSDDGSVQIWNAETGESLAILSIPEGLRSAHFDSKGKQVVAMSRSGGYAMLWDIPGQPRAMEFGRSVKKAAFSEDGRWVVTTSSEWNEGHIGTIWDTNTGKVFSEIKVFLDRVGGVPSTLVSASFSADARQMVTIDLLTWRIWEVRPDQCLQILKGEGPVAKVNAGFSPSGSQVAVLGLAKCQLLDASKGALVTEWETGKIGLNIQFTPDGSEVFTISPTSVRRWDSRSGRELATLSYPGDVPLDCHFDRSGQRVVIDWSERGTWIRDSLDGKDLVRLSGERVTGSSFSPDGSRVVGRNSEGVSIHEAHTGAYLTSFHVPGLARVNLDREGKRMLSITDSNTVKVWNVLNPSAGAPPDWFADLLRYIGRMRINSSGQMEIIPLREWLALREKLTNVLISDKSGGTPYTEFLQGVLNPPPQ